jgi:hypothetical protein
VRHSIGLFPADRVGSGQFDAVIFSVLKNGLPAGGRRKALWVRRLEAAVHMKKSIRRGAKSMENNRLNKQAFRLSSEIPHCRSLWIGVLQGSWREMGTQYGQRCGRDIARNFDMFWEKDVLGRGTLPRGERLWQIGRTGAEREKYCLAYIQRSFKELSFLSPELIEFFKGMARGAERELDKCAHADACSHFIKIAALNFNDAQFHPNWDFRQDRPGAARPTAMEARLGGDDCNSFWVSGKATKTGETYATRAVQSPHVMPGGYFNRQVAYVAIPKDPQARVFWGLGTAGNLGGLGGGLMNDRGVCCLTSGCSYSEENWAQADETAAPGIRDFVLAIYGVIFSKSAREAASRVTVGTGAYRKKTGRKTVLRARGANIVFADANEAFCVEQNARHYAIRKPGEQGEKGSNYIVTANHFKSQKGSFDENNIFHRAEQMTGYEPEREEGPFGSYYRFWSGMWMLRNNYGKIDREMVMRELVTAHYAYDKKGKRYDPDPETKAPSVRKENLTGTFCAHVVPFTKKYPLGLGGNAETSVFNLTTLEVWWVPVWPCHYKEWNLDWDYLNLGPFSKYRKMLWGY